MARRKPRTKKEAPEVVETTGSEVTLFNAPSKSRLAAIGELTKKIEAWKPAAEVLTRVKALPTEFVQVDHSLKIGGWPLERFALVHGPSNHGKTAFVHGLGLSFLRRGHLYAYVDAEFTTPEDWLARLMGDISRQAGFVAKRPRTFEETVDAVKDLCDMLGEAKAQGAVPPDTSAMIVIDSLRKLVPKNIMKKLEKEKDREEHGLDGLKGRGAMYRAALTGQWLDELVPMLYHSGATMVAIGRESENTEKATAFSPSWKLQGGKAAFFDSSVVARITRSGAVKKGSGKDAQVYGERHEVEIHKTKVAGKVEARPKAYFHTSNGVLVPEGFDKARDLVELGVKVGAIKKTGAWYTDPETGERWNGEHAMVKTLSDDPRSLHEFEARVRQVMQKDLNSQVDLLSETT